VTGHTGVTGATGPNNWTMLAKAADESTANDTTLSDDATLKFSMVANTKYRVRAVVFFDTVSAADFKYGLAGPAAPTLVRCFRVHTDAGGVPSELALDTALPATVSLTGNGSTGGYVQFEMTFHNGANAATFAFQWAQNTSNGSNTTVRAGSWMEYQTVP
jgi:hypothetical protein